MPPTRPGAAGNPLPSGADNQIASSNATASAFLGGRQLSWMPVGATTRKQSSRPAATRQPAVQTVQQQSAPAVLPSPAPSDEPSPSVSAALDSPSTKPVSLSETQNMGPAAAASSATLPITQARFVPDRAGSPEIQEVPGPAPTGSPPVAENRQPSLASCVSQAVGNGTRDGRDAHSPSLSFDGAPSQTAAPQTLPPLKRRRTDPPTSATSKYTLWLSSIDLHIQSCGGEQALDHIVERPRFQLLREACRSGDDFFIHVHHLFSVWSQNPPDAYSMIPQSPSAIAKAFGILESVLKKNEQLTPAHQSWFARFPLAPEQFFGWSVGHPALAGQIAAFLGKMAHNFNALTMVTVTRHYPYLVDELREQLACYSPLLQLVLFTACRRRLGVPDGALGSRMEQAFRDDQNRHRNQTTGLQEVAPMMDPTPLIVRYQQLVQAAKIGATVRSPTVPALSPASIPHLQQPRHSDHSSPVQNARIPHTNPVPHSISTQLPPIYPSSSMPVLPQAWMMAPNPYAANQGPNRTGTTPAGLMSNLQPTTQQHMQAPVHPQYLQQAQAQLPQYQASLQEQQQQQQQHEALNRQFMQHQAALQQLNYQQFQQNRQAAGIQAAHGGYSFPTQARHGLTQPPTAAVTSRPLMQPIQTVQQMQQTRQIQRTQATPPMASPTRFAANRAHATPLQASALTTPQSQGGGPEWHRDHRLMPPKGFQIPRQEWPYDASDRKSIMMSLHQAHIRSPKRVIREGSTERFYQAVKSVIVGPASVAPKNTIYEFRFEVTEQQFALAAVKSKETGSLLPVVEHFNGALRWRVRCCVVKSSPNPPTEQQWATLDVSWPPNIFMTLNHQTLSVRRQAHNGKDLATDVTDFIVRGTNVLKIGLPDLKRESAHNRFVAVELVETLSHSSIVDAVWSQGVIPEQVTLAIIKQRLTSPPKDDDDDDDGGVSFHAPDLSIDLADPFSATIFKVPARGATCTHMECFDLETWLDTRPAKPNLGCAHGNQGQANKNKSCACRNTPEPSSPDKWRCPICSRDARPYSLRIDGFLLKVRAQLEEQGRLRTKSMRVKADGSWSVVAEAAAAADDDGSDGEEGPAGGGRVGKAAAANVSAAGGGAGVGAGVAAAAAGAKREVEVIEIDSD